MIRSFLAGALVVLVPLLLVLLALRVGHVMTRVGNANSYQDAIGHLAAIYKTTVTLTDAQIKALPTTPITLLAAPASGFWNRLIGVTIATSFSTAGYTNVNTTYAAVQIETPTGDWVAHAYVNDSGVPMTDATNLLSGINGVYPFAVPTFFPSASNGWQQYVATLITKAHVDAILTRISIDNNGSGNLTGGNAANSMKVTLYYAVEAL